MICSKSNKQQKVNAQCILCRARYKVFRLGSFKGNILIWQGPHNPAFFQAQVKSPPCLRLGSVEHRVNGHGSEYDRTCQSLSVICSYRATGKRLGVFGGGNSSTRNPAPPPLPPRLRGGATEGAGDPGQGGGVGARKDANGTRAFPCLTN